MTTATRKSLVHLAILVGFVLVAALVAPLLDNPTLILDKYYHSLMYDVAINIMLGLGLNLVLGMTGQFSIGHAGFLAAGAYAAIVVSGKPEFFGPQLALWHGFLHLPFGFVFVMVLLTSALAGIVVAGVLGLVVGIPTLRLRGDYLAIATLGFGEILVVLVTNSDYLMGTSGANFYEMASSWATQAGHSNPEAAEAVKAYIAQPYILNSFWMMAGCLVTIYVVRNIKYSTTGRALLAIREDAVASESVGVPTTRCKVTAFIVGAALAGLAGGLLSHHKALNPANFTFMRSVEIILIVILGGAGSITGCVLAAIIITLLPEFLRSGMPEAWSDVVEKWRLVIYSASIVLLMLFRPRGLFGRYEITDLVGWLRHRIGSGSGTREPGSGPLSAAAVSQHESLPGPGPRTPDPEPRTLLSVSSLTMQFGGLRAVDDFSLTLRSGELVGLIGPNGAGKTTVFNVLTGVYRPTRGAIRMEGRSIVGYKPHVISQRGLARTFQNIRLFSDLSVLDNVMIAQHAHHRQGMPSAILRRPAFYAEESESRKRAIGYLDLFNLTGLANERANSLSYGDQRRLEIARALATRPRLLLLDEPAAGMNPTEKRELMLLIQSLRGRFGLTVLLIEHDMKVIMGVCERILVLDYGKTIAHGTPGEIRKNPAVVEAYLGALAKHD